MRDSVNNLNDLYWPRPGYISSPLVLSDQFLVACLCNQTDSSPCTPTLKMKAACSFEMSVFTYKTSSYHNQEDHSLNNHCCTNLKTCKTSWFNNNFDGQEIFYLGLNFK
jgi:hypothetical protein